MPPVWRCFCHGIFPSITVSGSPLIPAYSTSLTRNWWKATRSSGGVAITNNRAFDGCSLLAMGGLMLSFWLKENASGRRRIVIIGLVMLLTAVVLNQLGQALIPVKRASPTLSFEHIYRVSELLHIPTKDASKDSFPGDHGMMLLIFSAFMLRYFGKTAGIIALIIFVVFAFPRVMIGAHWFTDIVVGSLTVILIGLPWWLMTPLSDRAIALFENYLPGGNKQILNK
ncbi:Inner membrane protein yeiU [Salmonella enterica subsp. enterica serovar Heidelberg]|nr:Inner membrane protein yeiU [Salmonella enterica subsp. enterica serovar Heidelberg]